MGSPLSIQVMWWVFPDILVAGLVALCLYSLLGRPVKRRSASLPARRLQTPESFICACSTAQETLGSLPTWWMDRETRPSIDRRMRITPEHLGHCRFLRS